MTFTDNTLRLQKGVRRAAFLAAPFALAACSSMDSSLEEGAGMDVFSYFDPASPPKTPEQQYADDFYKFVLEGVVLHVSGPCFQNFTDAVIATMTEWRQNPGSENLVVGNPEHKRPSFGRCSPEENFLVERENRARFSEAYKTVFGDLPPAEAEKGLYAALNIAAYDLDPHSAVLSPAQTSDSYDKIRGHFAGTGMILWQGLDESYILIDRVVPNSGAADAGIRQDDLITHVNGQSAKGLTASDVARLILGDRVAGSTVRLGILREGTPMNFVVERRNLDINPIRPALLPGNIAYIAIDTFSDGTAKRLAESIGRMQRASDGPLNGVILDLRRNPGGLLPEAVQIADFFLKGGPILFMDANGGEADEQYVASNDGGVLEDMPLVVLVNDQSASASEILAGTLKENDRALLVGTTTFGKGSVQTVTRFNEPAESGGVASRRITTALYKVGPLDLPIQGQGVVPHIEYVPAAGAGEDFIEREADLPGALIDRTVAQSPPSTLCKGVQKKGLPDLPRILQTHIGNTTYKLTPDYSVLCALSLFQGQDPAHKYVVLEPYVKAPAP